MSNAAISHAQFFQDLWVVYESKGLKDGFFVEFGAMDGVSLSNSYYLEKTFGWRGILAEPLPSWHAELQLPRTVSRFLWIVRSILAQ